MILFGFDWYSEVVLDSLISMLGWIRKRIYQLWKQVGLIWSYQFPPSTRKLGVGYFCIRFVIHLLRNIHSWCTISTFRTKVRCWLCFISGLSFHYWEICFLRGAGNGLSPKAILGWKRRVLKRGHYEIAERMVSIEDYEKLKMVEFVVC